MIIRLLALIICLITVEKATAQLDSLNMLDRRSAVYGVELAGFNASGSRTPFWLQANQFGTIPRTGPASLLRIGTTGRFRLTPNHPNRSVSYGLEVVGIAGRQPDVLLPQAYVSLDWEQFGLWAGRKKEIIGLGDSTLSSGFYSWSGNALLITKVQVGTNGFRSLGFTNNIISINAFFAHGWFANSDSTKGSYLHQKAVYVRIGRPNWRVRFTGGVVHNAQWGGRSPYLPAILAQKGQIPNSFRDYLYVLTAREGGASDSPALTYFDRINRVGSHLGSIDFSVNVALGRWQAMGYYQHPFEDKSGVVFINFPDGLYGLRLQRLTGRDGGFRIDHILVEYLNTISQSGSIAHTGSRYDGRDNYFNNLQYLDGWVQDRNVIGTPFLSRRADIRPDVPYGPGKFIFAIANNKVELYHLGFAGTIGQSSPDYPTQDQHIRWQVKLSVSQNYGVPLVPFRQPVPQLSGIASVTWPLTWLGGSELRTTIALDRGQLYDNAIGGSLSLRKTWRSR